MWYFINNVVNETGTVLSGTKVLTNLFPAIKVEEKDSSGRAFAVLCGMFFFTHTLNAWNPWGVLCLEALIY